MVRERSPERRGRYRGRQRSPSRSRRRHNSSFHSSQRKRRSVSPKRTRYHHVNNEDRYRHHHDHYSTQTLDYSNAGEEEIEETEQERKFRWHQEWNRTKHRQPARPLMAPLPPSAPRRQVLEIRYWERTPINLERKQQHMEMLDSLTRMSREEWVLCTTLNNLHIELEPNLFPYETPSGVLHYTLWSRTYLEDFEVESFVENWLNKHRPSVTAWGWDPSNLMEGLSIDLFHVHVFLYDPNKRRPAVVSDPVASSHKAKLPLPDQ